MDQKILTLDTETCGLHGFIVLIQYAIDDGPIELYSPWKKTVDETIELLESFATYRVMGFNLAFDWFHIYKMWTVWKYLQKEGLGDRIPQEIIDLIYEIEPEGRDWPDCLKPVAAMDIFLHARKGPYQSLMDRKNVTIRKVPTVLARQLRDELERRVPFKDIYFARRKDKREPQWQIQDRHDKWGDVDPEWKNIIVRFKPSSALKALAADVFNLDEHEVLRIGNQVGVDAKANPIEFGYAPFAKAAYNIKSGNKSKQRWRMRFDYRYTWPDVIQTHINYWTFNPLGRKYASDDVKYTRDLYNYFGRPEPGDDDSELAIMVACCRWRGFEVDLRSMKRRRKLAAARQWEGRGFAPSEAKNYLYEVCSEMERTVINNLGGTAKRVLEEIIKDESWKDHPIVERAKTILLARKATKEKELYDKILAAGRFHASVKVIGSLSGRMSGTDGLNPLAINRTKKVKRLFKFAKPIKNHNGLIINYVCCGGDFDAFEMTIAEARYSDPKLRSLLLTCEKCEQERVFDPEQRDYFCPGCGGNKGKKIHAVFGTYLYPGMTYDEIKATDGAPVDKYVKSKSCLFLMVYGGEGFTINNRNEDIPLEIADRAVQRFKKDFVGIGMSQQSVTNRFQSMTQPNGRGTRVVWKDPDEKIATLLGFNRYFTLENRVTKALFELANKLPPSMRNLKLRVQRTDRMQFAGGAISSALYSAAFTIQSHNRRAAINHEIQGTGAGITKRVQRRLWDLQPPGGHLWIVSGMNIHDSIMAAVHPDYVGIVERRVSDTVESFREIVPLLKLPWGSHKKHWASK